LAVKDFEASRSFYEKFGFKVFAGDASQNWLIVKNGDHAIGLFQGMFEINILTFNPGWDSNAQKPATFGGSSRTQLRQRRRADLLAGFCSLFQAGPAGLTPPSLPLTSSAARTADR